MADRLEALLEPTVAGLGYELLGIERSRAGGGQLLRLYIDSPRGIVVDDCERVSHQVTALLEAERAVRGEYTLEVSSPGIERPLFTLAQHQRYCGEQVVVRLRGLLDGRRRLQGRLVAVGEDSLTLLLVDGTEVAVPYREVDRSRLVADWTPPQRPRRRGAAKGRGESPAGQEKT